ncbi:hypothetical protein Q7C36_022007 [Tachysurus vachellii]|uniref:Uncharacterized protein n=1 Tax=Tachysurus vachellii TaxID=175792 RepID=A0AA88IR13_TACVA|nr:hypothetical protein Q7C36_022007 [Tachysurus vachellii]
MDTGALWDRTSSDTEPPPFPAPTESKRKGTKRPLAGENLTELPPLPRLATVDKYVHPWDELTDSNRVNFKTEQQ